MNESNTGKIGSQTKINWVDAVPSSLMTVRSSVNGTMKLTPYELSKGRQFPGPTAGLTLSSDIKSVAIQRLYYDQLTALVSDLSLQIAAGRGAPRVNRRRRQIGSLQKLSNANGAGGRHYA